MQMAVISLTVGEIGAARDEMNRFWIASGLTSLQHLPLIAIAPAIDSDALVIGARSEKRSVFVESHSDDIFGMALQDLDSLPIL